MTINFELSEASIDEAIRQVNEYAADLQTKTRQLVDVASERLEEYATYELSKHIWTGETIASLHRVTTPSGYTARVLVGGAAIWLEFGTGVVTNNSSVGGYVHPKGAELGMCGLGTYGQGHGADPNFHGIPATMFMWRSAQTVRQDMHSFAWEVFRH